MSEANVDEWSEDDRLREALSHEVYCPCSFCKEMWALIDPEGERILPGEETRSVS